MALWMNYKVLATKNMCRLPTSTQPFTVSPSCKHIHSHTHTNTFSPHPDSKCPWCRPDTGKPRAVWCTSWWSMLTSLYRRGHPHRCSNSSWLCWTAWGGRAPPLSGQNQGGKTHRLGSCDRPVQRVAWSLSPSRLAAGSGTTPPPVLKARSYCMIHTGSCWRDEKTKERQNETEYKYWTVHFW